MARRSSAMSAEVGGVVVVVVGVVAHHPGVLGLGHVHGHIGVLEEVVHVDAVVGRDDVADARLDRQREPAHLDLVLDDVAQPAEHLLGVTDLGQDDAELVAAQAGHGVLGPDVIGEALGQLGEQLVAAVVAEGVVDLFEPVEVDDGDGGAESLRTAWTTASSARWWNSERLGSSVSGSCSARNLFSLTCWRSRRLTETEMTKRTTYRAPRPTRRSR